MSFSADWTQTGYNPADHGFWKADTGEANFGHPRDYFFADTMRAVSIALGNKFSNVYVERVDEKGYTRKRIQVPIKFGPRSKAHDYRTELENAEIDENGVVDPKYYVQNPNLTWKFTNGSYDGSRQTSSDVIRGFYDKYLLSKGVELTTCDLLWQDQMVIPVNIGIQLQANCDKESDAEQIFEQVIGKTKDSVLWLYVKEFWFMNIRRDIKVKLESFDWQFESDDMGEDAKREIHVIFNFTCEAVIYRPIENSSLITSIVTTLNPHIAGTEIARYGISGNAYMHDKYNNSAEYAKALSAKEFDGSITSGYDFTNNGRNSFGLASAIASSYNVELTPTQLTAYTDYTDVAGYTTKYIYSAIPDTWQEYDRNYRVLTATTYVFGKAKEGTIIISGGQYIYTSAYPDNKEIQDEYKPICIDTYSNYEYPYTGYYKNGFEYGNKYLEDSKQNIIDTIYGTSHTQISAIDD